LAKQKENNIENFRQLAVDQLNEKLVTLRKQLLELRLKELKNPHQLTWVRRNIARVLTVISEKSRQPSGQAGSAK